MPKLKIFSASQFTPTEHYTAVAKARWANDMVNFIMSGFAWEQFTRHLYGHLSNCFGHIAHFDRHGFYATWFSTPGQCMKWLMHVGEFRSYGSPEYTFCDVEKALQQWLSAEITHAKVKQVFAQKIQKLLPAHE